jgi:DNA polymerase-3 subunit alpha
MARKSLREYTAPDFHVHSGYSLLDGQGSPVDIVARAIELGWGAAALTEHGWMGSAPAFYQMCRAKQWPNGDPKRQIKPILGCEFYVVPDEILGVNNKDTQKSSRHLTVLALTKEGYQNLVAWQTLSMQRENFYHRPRLSIEAMIESAPWPLHHNVVLSGCMGGELCMTLAQCNGNGLSAGVEYVDAMKSVFPNFYVEIQNHSHEFFFGKGFQSYEEMCVKQDALNIVLHEISVRSGTPIVLTNDSHYQSKEQRKAHIAMLASKMNRWSKGDTHRDESDEHNVKGYVRDYAYWRNFMMPMEELEVRTPLAAGACKTILEIVDEVDIRLDPLDDFSYSIAFSGYDDTTHEIRARCKKRLHELMIKHGGDIAVERFEHELRAMGNFKHYLLMMSDFIKWAEDQGIYTEVRGSANASILCYCLKIHDIDSIQYKLTFERFVNPERKKMPDIDIDIEADRYPDFMKFVQQYVEEREGPDQIALICNLGTMANRSTFRMAAEAYGIEKETIDEIADLLPQMIDSGIVEEGDDAYSVLKDEFPELYDVARGIFDSPKNVSQHACGWIFGTKERPLKDWIPLYLIASSGAMVTQYDYKTIEKFGLTKGDFLRQKYLAVMKRCAQMSGMTIADLKEIPLDDPATMQRIRDGRTEGVFTLQGKTNRTGGMEVEPENEHGVIASVAIYRPSLTRPGYHKVYNNRRRGDEHVTYPHELAESVLGESFGLPIFQEQILDLGYAIGFDHNDAQELLDAIKLAKGIGRGAKEAFAKIKPKFIETASEKMTVKQATEMWDTYMESFQGYGFNRAHATGYGIRADRAAYLLEHHTQNFYVSLLDVYPEKHKYVAGARSEGFRFLPPDINQSSAGFTKGTDENSIRVGLARIHGVGPAALKSILVGQPFSSLDDLKERTPGTSVKVTTINNLAAAGALSSLGVEATEDDSEMLKILGFLCDSPKAMEGIEPDKGAVRRWTSDRGSHHLGLYRGVEITDYKESVSKLFWIPELPDDELLKKKASSWARVKTWLMLVVDENGIPFHIMVNEDRKEEVAYLDFIIKRHKGAVICFDGSIKKPFDTDGPMGFRFYEVTGANRDNPQVWSPNEDERMTRGFCLLSKKKRQARTKTTGG